MLILSRTEGETVDVLVRGEKVATIHVTHIKSNGTQVRLGLEGDRDVVTFVRSELRKEAA